MDFSPDLGYSAPRKSWSIPGSVLGNGPSWKSSPESTPRNSPTSSSSGYFPSPSPSPSKSSMNHFSLNDYSLIVDWENAFVDQSTRKNSLSSQATLTQPFSGTQGSPAKNQFRSPPENFSPPNLMAHGDGFRHSHASLGSGYGGLLDEYDVEDGNNTISHKKEELDSDSCINTGTSETGNTSMEFGNLTHENPTKVVENTISEKSRKVGPNTRKSALSGFKDPISIGDLADKSQIAQMNIQASFVRACRIPNCRSVPETAEVASAAPSVEELAALCSNLRIQRRPSQIRVRKDHWRTEKRHEREVQRLKNVKLRNRIAEDHEEPKTHKQLIHKEPSHKEPSHKETSMSHETVKFCKAVDEDTDRDNRAVSSSETYSIPGAKRSENFTKINVSHKVPKETRNFKNTILSQEPQEGCSANEMVAESNTLQQKRESHDEDELSDIGRVLMRTEIIRQEAENKVFRKINEERKAFFQKNKKRQDKLRRRQKEAGWGQKTEDFTRQGFQILSNDAHETLPNQTFQQNQDHIGRSVQNQNQNHRDEMRILDHNSENNQQILNHNSDHDSPHDSPRHSPHNSPHHSPHNSPHHSHQNLPHISPHDPVESPQTNTMSDTEILSAQQHALRYVRAAERDRQRVLNFPRGEPPKDEYTVIDEDIPPYQAHLHRYLDLMSYDERFSPVLRVNRYLVHGDGDLANAITKFSQFNLISTDLWSVSHVDERDYERLIPELIPSEQSDPYSLA